MSYTVKIFMLIIATSSFITLVGCCYMADKLYAMMIRTVEDLKERIRKLEEKK